MRDKRPVDELSIEELERILAIRKREERQNKLKRMERAGRVVPTEPPRPSIAFPPSLPEMQAETSLGASHDSSLPPRLAGWNGDSAAPQFDDEVMDATYKKDGDKDRFWRNFVNQSLLLMEVLAVVGLVFLGYQMFVATDTLQQETANAQALADEQRRASIPTIAPTPQIQLSQVVLPGGHIFTASGEVQFNYEEIPANLRYLAESQILQPNITRPPQTDETALQLTIPKINVDQTIVQGTDWEALKLGIGQLLNGINPGDEAGNLVLSGHNDIYGEVFRYLDQLEPGDEFFIRTQTKVFRYRITEIDTVDPTDVYVMESRGGATATLISCYPYKQNNKRIVIFAERVGDV